MPGQHLSSFSCQLATGSQPILVVDPIPGYVTSLIINLDVESPLFSRGEEKERYTHLNAEFQRTARRDKKAFLSDQCKEIEENNRRGNTRNLFKIIRDTKGTFRTKMGTIKDSKGQKYHGPNRSRRY